MKWTGTAHVLARTITFGAAALMLFALPGCGHKSVDDSLAAGDLAMQNTKLADAESDYRQAAATAPDDPRPHVALGNLYVFEQKPAQAEAEYMKALEFDKRSAPTHTALGNIFVGQSQPGLAEEQYRAAVAIDPTNPAYRINIGILLQKLGRTGEAEAQLRTAVGLDPKNAHAHLALAKLISGEPDRQTEAEAEFAQVRTLDPTLMPAAPAAPAPEAGASPATPPSGSTVPPPSETTSAPPPASASAAPMPKIRALDRKFMLTRDSAVYETPQETANVVAQVHRRKFVHVTGIAGNWFRIEMKNGTVGFIPLTAAE
jgi:tetratricopeptide (TPR) repeat protein